MESDNRIIRNIVLLILGVVVAVIGLINLWDAWGRADQADKVNASTDTLEALRPSTFEWGRQVVLVIAGLILAGWGLWGTVNYATGGKVASKVSEEAKRLSEGVRGSVTGSRGRGLLGKSNQD